MIVGRATEIESKLKIIVSKYKPPTHPIADTNESEIKQIY